MSDGPSPVVQSQRSGVQRVMKRAVLCCWLAMALFLLVLPLSARQASPPSSPTSANTAPHSEVSKDLSEKLAQLDQRVTAAQSAGDNAWMLTSAALVLMMTGPGLALFYGGLGRRQNTPAVIMPRFPAVGLINVVLALVGCSLAVCGEG